MSSSAEFRSFLLNMCIDALESTTIVLSSGFVEDGGGKHQVQVECGFVHFFELVHTFSYFPRDLCGRNALVSMFLPQISLQFF